MFQRVSSEFANLKYLFFFQNSFSFETYQWIQGSQGKFLNVSIDN